MHRYRYRVAESWGSLAETMPVGSHFLEQEDYGAVRQLTIFNTKLGRETGGAVGDFVDCVEVCVCGRSLVGYEHACPAPPMEQIP